MKKLVFILFCLPLFAFGQHPIVGKSIPAFIMKDVHNYQDRNFDPYKVKGKWLIIDFWNKHCVSCVQSFPKLNQLQKEFKNSIQLLLVGINDSKYNKYIEQDYERYRSALNLELTFAFDSILYKQFKVEGVPHVVIVAPDHSVYAVTYGSELTVDMLRNLMEGKSPKVVAKSVDGSGIPEPIWDEGATDNVIYKSLLANYNSEADNITVQLDSVRGKATSIGANLNELYNLAYFGQGKWSRRDLYFNTWPRPLLHIGDSTAFLWGYYNQMGLYNYSLKMPTTRKSMLQKAMQKDLKNVFGYNVRISKQQMPCWELVSSQTAREKLRSRAASYHHDDFGIGGILNGKMIPIESILSLIQMYQKKNTIPFFDRTGIKGSIDISFSAAMTDLNDVAKALAKHGLILQQGTAEMRVLIIEDEKQTTK